MMIFILWFNFLANHPTPSQDALYQRQADLAYRVWRLEQPLRDKCIY